jgi:hypothetical protein
MDQIAVSISNEECAVIIGHDGEHISVRLETGTEPEGSPTEDDEAEIPLAQLLGVAIAMRLANDATFADEMLAWYEEYSANQTTE